MIKGNLMVDALLGLMMTVCCIAMVGMFLQCVVNVDEKHVFLDKWQLEENTCEIWCK